MYTLTHIYMNMHERGTVCGLRKSHRGHIVRFACLCASVFGVGVLCTGACLRVLVHVCDGDVCVCGFQYQHEPTGQVLTLNPKAGGPVRFVAGVCCVCVCVHFFLCSLSLSLSPCMCVYMCA